MATLGKLSNRATRLVMGLIVGIGCLYCVVRGGLPLMFLLTLFIVIGSIELVKILKNKGFYPYLSVILAANASLCLLFWLKRLDLYPIVIVLGTISSFLAVMFNGRQPYIANVATTALGIVYSSLPMYIILIRQINYDGFGVWQMPVNEGLNFILFLFLVVIVTDVAAYYVGSKFGKHKLSPVISPNKTVEGAVGAVVFAVLTGMLTGYFIKLPWYHSLILAFLITIFAQLGDLAESMIKRDAGVKDSGDAIAGHGGFLDRADSFMFSCPIAYFYIHYFVVNNNVVMNIMSCIKKVLDAFGF